MIAQTYKNMLDNLTYQDYNAILHIIMEFIVL